MPILYKVNLLKELKEKGYTTNRIRAEKLFGEGVVAKMRHDELISYDMLARVCALLDCQPGDLLRYEPDLNEFQRDSSRSNSAGKKKVDGKFVSLTK